MKGNVSVYLRGDTVVAVPQGGGGGVYYDIDPVAFTSSSSVEEVERMLLAALDASAALVGQPLPNLRERKSPVPRAVGVKNIRDFYADSTHALLYTDGGALFMWPFRPRSPYG